MHLDILTPDQQSALAVLARQPVVGTFYLAGGTALALQLGHRESVDFDFFRRETFDPPWLLDQLPTSSPIRILQEATNTLTVDFQGVKTSFFAYPHDLLQPALGAEAPVPLASVPDIAAMKLAAIGGRGARKDFVDLYFIGRDCFPLREAVVYLEAKFSRQEFDLYHILRSLT